MTTVGEILDFVEALAPESMKMDWDNVGLLLGSRTKPVTKILVALDPFEDVAQEAADWGAELIVTHHPLFFRPARNLTDETSVGRTALLLSALVLHEPLSPAGLAGAALVLSATLLSELWDRKKPT